MASMPLPAIIPSRISRQIDHDGGRPNDFTALWNGATLLSLSGAPGQPYTHYTFNVTATSSTEEARFSESVTALSAVIWER